MPEPPSPPNPENEAAIALMNRVREGDERAFGWLYAQHHRGVQNFFYALTRDSQAAYDLCQDTFVRIWKTRQRYAATGSFKAYLFTFGRHIWLEHRRRAIREQRLGTPAALDDYIESLLANAATAPGELASRSESRDVLAAALEELPEDQRIVFSLRYIQGLDLDEIARVMDCPVNTVRSRKLAALRKLRSLLQAYRTEGAVK